MKRIIIILSFLLLSFSTCLGNYFDNNPSKYFKFASVENIALYLDTDSVSVERYEPPYYIIKVDMISDDFYKNEITQYTIRNFYNYNTRVMQSTIDKINLLDNEGNLKAIVDMTPDSPRVLIQKTPGYFIANFAFLKSYNMYFSKDYQDKYNTRMLTSTEIFNEIK